MDGKEIWLMGCCDFCGEKNIPVKPVGVKTENTPKYIKIYLCDKCIRDRKTKYSKWKFLI